MVSESTPFLERLLYVASARPKITWKQWKEACRSLVENDVGAWNAFADASTAARILDELGHVDIKVEESQVSLIAAPATLARLPKPGTCSAVLCGGRSPDAARCLADAAARHGSRFTVRHSVVDYSDTHARMIPVFQVDADDIESLKKTAEAAKVLFAMEPPAWVLAHAAGGINDYVSGLAWRHGPEQNVEAREYCLKTLSFIAVKPGTTGMRLIYYRPRVGAPYHELRDGNRAARTDRQWGAYACLQAGDVESVIYDRRRRALAIPAAVPLPRPLGRVFALCSGEPPCLYRPPENISKRMMPYSKYLIYYDVPSNIASLVLARLGQIALPFSLPDKP